jgi:hypothetical protein
LVAKKTVLQYGGRIRLLGYWYLAGSAAMRCQIKSIFFSFFFSEHSAKSNQIFFHFSSLQNMMPNQIKSFPFSYNEPAPTSAPSIGCLLLLNYG